MRISLTQALLALVLSCGLAGAQDHQADEPDNAPAALRSPESIVGAARALSDGATLAARRAGVSTQGGVSCDVFGSHCTCSGAFHCAWLAYACDAVGGIEGFDGECFLPRLAPREARAGLSEFILTYRLGGQEAHCEGPECFCSGGADSDDCNRLTACIDDIMCIGDSCGCWGGTVED